MGESSTLPQELIEHIASYLPLWATPSSLLALALTSHSYYVVIRPMIHTILILRSEADALNVIQMILADLDLGRSVRELHIMSELSKAISGGKPPFDVVTGIEWAVRDELFPNLQTFGLHLLHGWRKDERGHTVFGYGQLNKHFWTSLRHNCPRFRSVIVSGIGDTQDDRWLQYSGIYDLADFKDLINVSVVFRQHTLDSGPDTLLKNIRDLSSSLHTLQLGMNHNFESALPVLSHHFPYLKTLHLESITVYDTTDAMVFWRRHPTLEIVRLPGNPAYSRWFSNEVEAEMLPNLRHLQANFHDVQALSPILHHVVSLSIRGSFNGQVAYLLRYVIPNGLPNLKGLEIHQHPTSGWDRFNKSAMWYETLEGEFAWQREWKNGGRAILDDIHSIAKGAPNLEELALHPNFTGVVSQKELLAHRSALALFTSLERLYYFGPESDVVNDRVDFYRNSGLLAESCKKLNLVTDFRSYTAAQIRRRGVGNSEALDAVHVKGRGMQIGYENEAFPRIYR